MIHVQTPKKPRRPKDAAEPTGRACDAESCELEAMYKAPKAPGAREYHWFCLEHVRAYNQSWDFFNGMTEKEMLHFMKEAVTGHRPTWRLGSQPFGTADELEMTLRAFLGEKREQRIRAPRINGREQQALTLFDLTFPLTLAQLKARYKVLVKRYHPDVNMGSKKAEEKFKQITLAYQLLTKRLTRDEKGSHT